MYALATRVRLLLVTRGLDPRVHRLRKNFFAKGMDCRVKPGNDGGWLGVSGRTVAGSLPQAPEQQHEAREKQRIRGGVGEAARRPFHVLQEARAEADAQRDRGKDQRERDRPRQRQEAAGEREDEKRQQQNEREIAEIGLAEEYVLGGAQVAQARREVEDGLAAFERAGEV